MWPNSQKTADLVTFTEETLKGKLDFLRISFRGKFLKNSLGACFIKYMSAIARLKNVDAKKHHIKKYIN